MAKSITVNVTVNKALSEVWDYWNGPEHVPGWAFASDDWECAHAGRDLKVGGCLLTRMQPKDKSVPAFDVVGTYTAVEPLKLIEYRMDDNRVVRESFEEKDGSTSLTQTFELESQNSEELQRSGWQAILENFKKYAETK